MGYVLIRQRDFGCSHYVWGNFIYIIIEGDSRWVQIEILDGLQIAGGGVTHVLQLLAGADVVVCHQLFPKQVGQRFLIVAFKEVVQADGA